MATGAAGHSANRNRKIRQDALREQLAAQGHVQHIVDIAKKLSNLDEKLDQTQIQRLKVAADIKQKLIAKYIPDLKSVELTGEAGDSIKADLTWNVEVKKPG